MYPIAEPPFPAYTNVVWEWDHLTAGQYYHFQTSRNLVNWLTREEGLWQGTMDDYFEIVLPLSSAIEFQRAPLSLSERIAKRALDLTVAITGIVLLTPMFLIIALAIKLDSGGPALFLQTRHGFNSKKFKIFKFRTMAVLDDGATIDQAVRGDKRVTNIGRWLRKTSIDELPQLFNVLKGEMSIVGPRPHAAAHDEHYKQLISCYAFRHHMKPGITGWAQVNGYRGETPTLRCMKERVDYDIWYVDNWSVLLDLKIIFGTFLELIRGRNAY